MMGISPQIEHRLFSYISINWRAKPLASRQTVIDLIAATTTSTGLKVYARLDPNTHATKIKISDDHMQAVQIAGEKLHPEWNYTITPHQ
jgi:Rhodopirellula transposase DDE domain